MAPPAPAGSGAEVNVNASPGPRRPFSQQTWFPAIIIAGSAVLCIAALFYAREDALASSADLSRAVTTIVTEQADRSVALVQHRLLHVSEQFDGAGAPSATAALDMLAVERTALPHCQALFLLDAAGRVLFASSNSGSASPDALDAAGLRAVAQRLRSVSPRAVVFELVQVNGKAMIYAALARRGPDGAVLAMAVSRLEPAYFSSLWNGVDLGRNGSIALVRDDGVVLAAVPASGAGRVRTGAILDMLRMEARYLGLNQTLPGYPNLHVSTRRSMHELLAPWRHFALLVAALWFGGSAAVVGLFCLLRRILDKATHAVEALRRSDQKFAAAFRASPDGILLTALESGRFIEVSDSVTRMTGYSRAELLGPGMTTATMWVDMAERDDYVARIRRDGRVVDLEARFRIKSGEERIGQMSGEIVTSGDETLIMGIIRDITAQKQREQVIWEQGNFDSLTGLPNRHMFRATLQNLLNGARGATQPFVLLLIDLDQFKEVNDTLGHEVGDRLLVAVAERLRSAVGAGVTVARLGGDEFTVLLGGADVPAPDDVAALAAGLVRQLAQPFALGADMVYVSASIGVAHYPEAGASAEELLRHADQAMYAAKSAGRNRFCHYVPALQAAAQDRAALTLDLRGALAGGQFSLAYQPIVAMADGAIGKAEALLRWIHPVRGAVSPGLFIPVAEQSGLIIGIGDWVFHEAAAVLAQMRAEADPGFEISINVSPVQFQNDADLPARWLAHLDALGIPASALTVEITEGLLLDVTDEVRTSLAALGRAGMQIALDDFGTGYSSLAYLKKFDIDFLKIDRAFVDHIETNPEDRALCEAIVAMAHTLGLRVTVEGVETAGQYALMQQMACDYAQGYFLSRAVPAASLKLLCAGSLTGPAGMRRRSS